MLHFETNGNSDTMRGLTTMNLRSIILFSHTLVSAFIGLIAVLIWPTGQLFIWFARTVWARQLLWLSGMTVSVKGKENIDKNGLYIICANHQSLIDIPLLFACLPVPIRFLAKRSLFYIPIFGWSLYLAGFIPVDRGISSKARRSLDRGAKRIKRGPSLVIFPEGTRTPDGSIHKFKTGAFTMAIRSSVPIVPVAIRGTSKVVPKNSIAVTPAHVEMDIGNIILTKDFKMKDKAHLRRRTQKKIEAMFRSDKTDTKLP
ncbi:MAG: 1-acyl-sn-glycerol-3-phosphate acyltransferase [Proteobacteria bacterium]|nr:1-acyl-sn-glycerol-3-phosphate acyltransferase [Pseudomonadota bacterium]